MLGLRKSGKFLFVLVAALLISVFALSAISFARNGNPYRPSVTQEAVSNTEPAPQPGNCCGYGIQNSNIKGSRFSLWAQALGISEDALRLYLSQGKTIADIAKEKGLDLDEVVSKVLSKDKEYLDTLVSQGKITEEDKERILQFRKERLLERANTGLGKPSWANGRSCGRGCGRCLNNTQQGGSI